MAYSVSIVPDKTIVQCGYNVTYTLTLSSVGGDAADTTVLFQFGANSSRAFVSAAQLSGATTFSPSFPVVGSTGNVRWSVASWPANGEVDTFQVVVTDIAGPALTENLRYTSDLIPSPGIQQNSTVVVTSPPVPEFRHGPAMFGAPWLQGLPFARTDVLQIPALTQGPLLPEIHSGPPLRGAPWLQLLPGTQAEQNLFGPRNPPALPLPLGPGRGLARPFFPRVPDTADTRRLSRLTENLTSMLNSLISQGILQQTAAQAWTLRSPAISMTRAPLATDDISVGAIPGALWLNTLSTTLYICVSNTQNAAVWKQINLS